MRAIVFVEKGKVEVWDDLETPPLKPDEVRLKTLFTGITIGTERHCLLGGPYSGGFPMIPGYQTVSEVADIGSKVEGFATGDIVFSDEGSEPVNFAGSSWGGHTEIRNRDTTGNIIKLPEGMSPTDACFLGIMGIGLKAAKRGGVKIRDRVLVIGLGLIGQACAQAANAMGAYVEGIDLMPDRRDLAAQLSCTRVWDAGMEGIWEAVRADGGFDVVFETTGVEDMPDKALQSLTVSTGRMVAIGGKFVMKYDNLSSGQGFEATIIHTSHFGLEELQDLVRLIPARKANTKELITHRVPVETAPEIYRQLIDDPSGMLGIVFDWRS
jgi:2-desacetyl-2-hydroxyethyl bacteriochlorophyllide A dehydrogenase